MNSMVNSTNIFFLSAHYVLGRMWTLMSKTQSLPLKVGMKDKKACLRWAQRQGETRGSTWRKWDLTSGWKLGRRRGRKSPGSPCTWARTNRLKEEHDTHGTASHSAWLAVHNAPWGWTEKQAEVRPWRVDMGQQSSDGVGSVLPRTAPGTQACDRYVWNELTYTLLHSWPITGHSHWTLVAKEEHTQLGRDSLSSLSPGTHLWWCLLPRWVSTWPLASQCRDAALFLLLLNCLLLTGDRHTEPSSEKGPLSQFHFLMTSRMSLLRTCFQRNFVNAISNSQSQKQRRGVHGERDDTAAEETRGGAKRKAMKTTSKCFFIWDSVLLCLETPCGWTWASMM